MTGRRHRGMLPGDGYQRVDEPRSAPALTPEPEPEPASEPEPPRIPRFQQRMAARAELERTIDPQPRPERQRPVQPAEEEPTDLISRTKRLYDKAKAELEKLRADIAEAETLYEEARAQEAAGIDTGYVWHREHYYKPTEKHKDDARSLKIGLEDAIAWERRRRYEYESALRGKDRTDYLARMRKILEATHEGGLRPREYNWRRPGVPDTPGETMQESIAIAVMRVGYDPDIPAPTTREPQQWQRDAAERHEARGEARRSERLRRRAADAERQADEQG